MRFLLDANLRTLEKGYSNVLDYTKFMDGVGNKGRLSILFINDPRSITNPRLVF